MIMLRALRYGAMVCCVVVLSACSTYRLPQQAVPVSVDPVFTDHIVLQRDLPVRIWGKANPGEPVKVSFAGQTCRTKTDVDGKWSVILTPMKASGESRRLIVRGHNEVVIQDVVVGEVWLCSGQSNMEYGLLGVPTGREDIKTANFPLIRMFSTEKQKSLTPQDKFNGAKGWVTCSPENIKKVGVDHGPSFSAAAFYYGRELHAKLGIPIGLIEAAWGGSEIEYWTPRMNVRTIGGEMYNAMVAPLTPMTIRGAIWYQGESNRQNKGAYEGKMKDLIGAWRTAFQRPDMPFYFVEIAPFKYGGNDPAALGELRAAQARVAASVPHTGMIHTLDNPEDLGNIHPFNKRQIGERLARLALSGTYGITLGKSLAGPTFRAAQREGTGVMVSFSDTADALITADGRAPEGFEGLVSSGLWAKASAEIRGDKVWVNISSQTVAGVRFCWLDTQMTNLRNVEGFPPSPFSVNVP
jgi:sialate O-acetylesterase